MGVRQKKIHVFLMFFLAFFPKKKRKNQGLAGDRDVCDRKSRRFAIAIFGALKSAGAGRRISDWNAINVRSWAMAESSPGVAELRCGFC